MRRARLRTWSNLGAGVSLTVTAVACGSSSTDSAGPPPEGGPNPDASRPAVTTGPGDATGGLEGASGNRDGGPSAESSAAAQDAARQDGSQQDVANPDASPQDAAAQPADGSDAAGTTMPVYVTFYGWADNSPPGNAIAYPKSGGQPTVHDAAGGVGTFADPITFATDPTEFVAGTRLYVPFIQKYVTMEDSCGQCATDWTSHMWHIDIWMNSGASENANALLNCENSWTRSQTDIELNPPPTRTVTTAPLFDPSSNTCRMTP